MSPPNVANGHNYLRNAWYVAGFADELPPDALLVRTLLDQPVVFFRQQNGGIAALQDMCPHRFAPLSLGRVCDGVIQCGYHGLKFDGNGVCVDNPLSPGGIPKALRVRRHAAMEKHGLVWFWAGDPFAADGSQIPDYSFLQSAHPDASFRGYMIVESNFQLLVDNILDLTHADFLHAKTLGSGAIASARPEITDLGERSLEISWYSTGARAPAAFDQHLRTPGAPTEQWTEVTWTAPGLMKLRVGATLVGERREAGFDSQNLHLATPEGLYRTHYWYWTTRNCEIDAEANANIRKFVDAVFTNEDKPMLQGQARRMGEREFWAMKPMLFPGDAGVAGARRKLAALIAAERNISS